MILNVAPKLYFTHYLCVVIILFDTGLCKTVFFIFSFEKAVSLLSVFPVFSACAVFLIRCDIHRLYNICLAIVPIGVRCYEQKKPSELFCKKRCS